MIYSLMNVFFFTYRVVRSPFIGKYLKRLLMYFLIMGKNDSLSLLVTGSDTAFLVLCKIAERHRTSKPFPLPSSSIVLFFRPKTHSSVSMVLFLTSPSSCIAAYPDIYCIAAAGCSTTKLMWNGIYLTVVYLHVHPITVYDQT